VVILIVVGLVGVLILLMIARLIWRLWRGDEELEPAGTWSAAFRRNKDGRPGDEDNPE